MNNFFKKLLQNNLKNCQGFTFVEIVIIIIILGIAIPATMNLISSNLINSTKSEFITQAAIFAQEKMDEIIADKRSSSRGYNWVVSSNRYSSDTPSTGYTRSVYIDTTAKVQNGIPYALVRVSVSHSEAPVIELTTWLTEY